MKPNSGSYQAGRESDKKQPIGSVVIRTDKTGKPRAWVKVAERGTSYDWKLRAVVNWEKAYGLIPSGLLIHHKDRNTLNDDLDNLELMDRAGHLSEHRPEFDERRRRAASLAIKRRYTKASPQ